MERILDRSRQELLDLSARNRLISTPRDSSRSKRLDIVDERSVEVFRLLVLERKSLTFLPGRGEDAEDEQRAGDVPGLSQPDDDGPAADRHVDLRLQTRLTSEGLQTRLLDLSCEARTSIEEQGVSILYLALGFLKWYEAPTSDKARYAPLLLIPVELERLTAASRFRLKYREEEIATNLSLKAKLWQEFQVNLPEIPESEELGPQAYFDAVAMAIGVQPRWEVLGNDIVLWFFSFAKYLMYRDLTPENWPEHAPLAKNGLLCNLLNDGFPNDPPLCSDLDKIDELILPDNMIHVTDADSSQALVIEEVRRGRNLVVQGPPGTGKSQTITNMIATAVKEGKKVLFVAEKLAALEVVKSRLDRLGLGPLCLELHSHKANKREVLDEISRTMNLGRPKMNGLAGTVEALRNSRDRLNRHAAIMNSALRETELTPFQILGRLVVLYANGGQPVDFELNAAVKWSRKDFIEKCGLLQDLEVHLRRVGVPRLNPWNGVHLATPPLPTDLQLWIGRIQNLFGQVGSLLASAHELAQLLRVKEQESVHLRAAESLARLAGKLLAAPSMDRQQIADPVWEQRRDAIAELVQKGQSLETCHSQLSGVVSEIAWDTDLQAARWGIGAYGKGWFPRLYRKYRDGIACLRGVMVQDLPAAHADRMRIVDTIIKAQKLARELENESTAGALGRAAFGSRWNGVQSKWAELAAILAWEQSCRDEKLPKAIRQVAARFTQPDSCRRVMQLVDENASRLREDLPQLCRDMCIDVVESLGTDELDMISLDALSGRLKALSDHSESLSKWVAFSIREHHLRSIGLETLVDRVCASTIAGDAVLAQFQLGYYEALLRDLFRSHPTIATFDGETYEQWIAEFRQHDLNRIEFAKLEVALSHYEAIPRGAGLGDTAVVRREIEKKRNVMPIRKLLKEAGNAVQSIKPVFMMSPISIAQFLEPGLMNFDLLLIDEASQVSPVDAFGAIARAKQIVVVGDSKQLPPTSFFQKMLDDDAPPEDEAAVSAGDLESVLGLCLSRGVMPRMLQWHYRSRHHSLIAVSNREFYDNRLFVVPSPTTTSDRGGLRFRYVEDGVFDRGGTRTNMIEARAVAKAAIDHARASPKLSLGVGAFSVAQRDAIRDELELLLRQETGLHEFFSPGRADAFFIKNLENIQGDERDVIFISVGYGKDSSGFMAMSFGPLSTDGGERRLNVLISRARLRCEVFSSITADTIDLERGRSVGVAAFKTFLRFAETGLLDDRVPTGRDFDSDFERQVSNGLTGLGYHVDCQVGSSGFILDLAVLDPETPGRYVLGIECDGATYHSSRAARDRDRLREQVLRDRGWQIHRIWSTDWFHRPKEQLQKAVAAIERARAEAAAANFQDKPAAAEPAAAAAEVIGRDSREAGEPANQMPDWVVTYREFNSAVATSAAIQELAPKKLDDIVLLVIRGEGPVHRDEIPRRMATLWGMDRAGSRIVDSVTAAIDRLVRNRDVVDRGAFISASDQKLTPVRNRQDVASSSLRKLEYLPPDEIREALRRLVSENVGARRDEVRTTAARILGFRTTSAQLKEILDRQIDGLLQVGQFSERDEKLFIENNPWWKGQ
jgi:very-short-patch-repair endonuclease